MPFGMLRDNEVAIELAVRDRGGEVLSGASTSSIASRETTESKGDETHPDRKMGGLGKSE